MTDQIGLLSFRVLRRTQDKLREGSFIDLKIGNGTLTEPLLLVTLTRVGAGIKV